MSTQKVTPQEHVSSATQMMKIAQARLASSSSSPVSAPSDSAGAGSATDQQLPTLLHGPILNVAAFFAPAEENEAVEARPSSPASSLHFETDGEDSSVGTLFSPEDAVKQINSYEKNHEAGEPVVKKVTKAFG